MPLSLSPGLWTLCPLILTLPPFSTLPIHGSLQALRQTRSARWLWQPRLAQTPSIHYNVQVGYWPHAWALFPSLLLLLPWLEVIPNPPAIQSYIVDSFLSWVLFYSQLISHELAFTCSPGASSVIISLQLEFNPFRGWRGGHGLQVLSKCRIWLLPTIFTAITLVPGTIPLRLVHLTGLLAVLLGPPIVCSLHGSRSHCRLWTYVMILLPGLKPFERCPAHLW